MRFDVVVQVREGLDAAQLGHGNLNLVRLLDEGHQVHQAQAVQLKGFAHVSLGSKEGGVYFEFIGQEAVHLFYDFVTCHNLYGLNDKLDETSVVTDFPSSGEEGWPTAGVVAADIRCK